MKTPFIITAVACCALAVTAAPAYAAEPPKSSTTVSITDDQVRVVVDGVEIIIDTSGEGKPVLETPDAVTTAPTVPAEPSTSEPVEKQEEQQSSSMVDEIIRLTNAERAKEGLPAYTVEPCLMQSAQKVSETMAAENLMKHSDLSGIKACGVTGSENIAEGYDTPAQVVAGWMGSTEGHREAILSTEHDTIGVGYVEDGHFYTQHFGNPKEEQKA